MPQPYRTITKKYYQQLLAVSLLLVFSATFPAFADTGPVVIKISVLPGLQYDVPRFHVHPGQQVELVFSNTDDMDHNLLILRPGSRVAVVQAAGAMASKGPSQNYVPQGGAVLWSAVVVHSGQTKTIRFTAPKEEDVYPYVCTLPGHGQLMYGAMYVNKTGDMPPLEHDINIPESRRNGQAVTERNHPYELKPPYYYRTYVEGAGPAAIVVHLPGDLSFCWDAGSCRLRFVWQGDFVDNSQIWKGHTDGRSEVLGDVFYREKEQNPIQLGSDGKASLKAFKGYKLVDGGYLEFHYTVDGQDVYETVKESAHGVGIVRKFRVPALETKLTFHFTEEQRTTYYYKSRPLTNGAMVLAPADGTTFQVDLLLKK